MRVVIYAPGAARTRRAVARDATAAGHTIVGDAATPADARLAITTGIADGVAGRAEHLLELVRAEPGLLANVIPVAPRPRRTAAAVLVLPAAWLVNRVRRHPRAAAAGTVAAAGVVAAALVFAGNPPPQERAAPPAAVAPTSARPSTSPSQPASVRPAPTRAATPASRDEPAPASRPAVARQVPAADAPHSRTPAASSPPTSPRPPATSGPPAPSPTPTSARCILHLDIVVVEVRLCLQR